MLKLPTGVFDKLQTKKTRSEKVKELDELEKDEATPATPSDGIKKFNGPVPKLMHRKKGSFGAVHGSH